MQSIVHACDGSFDVTECWLHEMSMDDPRSEEAQLDPCEAVHRQPTWFNAADDDASAPSDAAPTRAAGRDAKEDPASDVYWTHRKQAIKLTQKWQKMMRRYALSCMLLQ
jgi:hypothetical protein